MAKVEHPRLDVAQELREQRGLLTLCVEMLWRIGRRCEEKKLDHEARQAYAVMCVLMERLDQIDQALAVLGEGTVRQTKVEMVCGHCATKNGATARLNVLLEDGEQAQWETLRCSACGADVGHYRKDPSGMPKGYVLAIEGVLDYEKDTRTLEERLPEAAAIAKHGVVKPEELPSAEELRVKALLEGGVPVGVQHGEVPEEIKKRQDIRRQLEEAKRKMQMKMPMKGEEDDF